MITRVPIEMLAGKTITGVTKTAPRVQYTFTDGTFAIVELPIPAAIEVQLSELEMLLSEHTQDIYPSAHQTSFTG